MKLWRVSLFAFCLAAVLTQPWFVSHYYSWMLEHGAYRWDADSIAIPIMNEGFIWMLWAPVMSVSLFFVFRKIKAPFRLLAWNTERKVISWIISIGCCIPIASLVQEIILAVPWKNYVEIAYSLWWIAVWLLVRAALLTKKEANQQPDPTRMDGCQAD